jgi:thiamine-monophosphate kinase
LNEFELIQQYFSSQGLARDDVVVAIGDDAAVVTPSARMQQVVTTDMLVAGTHFLADADPHSIGYKSLAVNLSDLAAMGASPTWFTLNLSLPGVDRLWLEWFRDGLFRLAGTYGVQLIGGDTVRGPLVVGVQAFGVLPAGTALMRSGARPRDRIYVTGTLGDAGLALAQQRNELALSAPDREIVMQRLHFPAPRVSEGVGLRDVASSCIDISDGLLADLGHILQASAVGARVVLERIPVSSVYRQHFEHVHSWDAALKSGDDYELCFTVPAEQTATLERLGAAWACGVSYIGDIEAAPGLRLVDAHGRTHEPTMEGFDHFADD